LILSESRDMNFIMDPVRKDMGCFRKRADIHALRLKTWPCPFAMMRNGQAGRSDRMIERLEDPTGRDIRAPGVPQELVDTGHRTAAMRSGPRA
jgi:3-hydroxyisobutyrate dehydrogenase